MLKAANMPENIRNHGNASGWLLNEKWKVEEYVDWNIALVSIKLNSDLMNRIIKAIYLRTFKSLSIFANVLKETVFYIQKEKAVYLVGIQCI